MTRCALLIVLIQNVLSHTGCPTQCPRARERRAVREGRRLELLRGARSNPAQHVATAAATLLRAPPLISSCPSLVTRTRSVTARCVDGEGCCVCVRALPEPCSVSGHALAALRLTSPRAGDEEPGAELRRAATSLGQPAERRRVMVHAASSSGGGAVGLDPTRKMFYCKSAGLAS